MEGLRCTYTRGPGATELASRRHGLRADESLLGIFRSLFLLISLKISFGIFISRRSFERGLPGRALRRPWLEWLPAPGALLRAFSSFVASFFPFVSVIYSLKRSKTVRGGCGRAGVYVHLRGPPIAAAPSRARVWRQRFAAKSISLRLFPF